MSDTTVIIRGFAGFTFDAVFEEDHTLELEVTDNPVETGVAITDHSYMKPNKIRMTAGVSNHRTKTSEDAFGSGNSRAANAYAALEKLMRTREPFDVQTGLKLYKNMICTSVSTVQDKESSNTLMFTADLREIIIVNTQVVTYPPRKAGKATNQASKKKESGEKQGKEPEERKKGSLAKSLAKVFGK